MAQILADLEFTRYKFIEKGLASDQRLAKQRIGVITPLQHRMEQKGQQVEAEQKRRQVPLAVTKIVLDMVAFGL